MKTPDHRSFSYREMYPLIHKILKLVEQGNESLSCAIMKLTRNMSALLLLNSSNIL